MAKTLSIIGISILRILALFAVVMTIQSMDTASAWRINGAQAVTSPIE